jgi:hypothetical protein
MVPAAAATGAAAIVRNALGAVVVAAVAAQNLQDVVISGDAMIVPMNGVNPLPRRLRCRKST